MAYFQMDDGTDTELRVFKVGTAAFGLYARCGVWVARNLTDGFVPAEVAASYGTREWIDKLVASGLWTLEDGGFGMPDYLGKHDNKTAVEVRKRRADAAARQAKMRENRKRRQAPNMSPGESRVTHTGTHGVTHTTQSDPPPKGGEEGDAPLRGGGAPPSTRTLTSGRVVCATHSLEVGNSGICRGCIADANVDDDLDDLDQKPPVPQNPNRRPHMPTARGPAAAPPPTVERDPEHQAAVDALSAVPPEDVGDLLAAAAEQLAATGHPDPSERDLTVRAAALSEEPA